MKLKLKMHKSIAVFLMISICCLTGCLGKINEQKMLLTDQIEVDFYEGTDAITQAQKSVVDYNIISVENNIVEMKISAPDIAADLTEYINSLESTSDFSENEFQKIIISLIQDGEKITNIFSVEYSVEGEQIKLNYTKDVTDAFTCGLTKYYRDTINELMGGE